MRSHIPHTNLKLAHVQRGALLELDRPGWVTLSHNDGIDIRYQLGDTIYAGRTAYHEVLIARSPYFGKMLILNNELQTAESDAESYNQQLLAPMGLQSIANKKVLLLGGGDGTLAASVLVSEPSQVVVVDIDGELIETCRKHFIAPASLSDTRIEIVIDEAFQFLSSGCNFDTVIYDLTMHPDVFTDRMRVDYLTELFQAIHASIYSGGSFSFQCGSEFDVLTKELLTRLVTSIFGAVHFTEQYIPSRRGKWIFGVTRKL